MAKPYHAPKTRQKLEKKNGKWLFYNHLPLFHCSETHDLKCENK